MANRAMVMAVYPDHVSGLATVNAEIANRIGMVHASNFRTAYYACVSKLFAQAFCGLSLNNSTVLFHL